MTNRERRILYNQDEYTGKMKFSLADLISRDYNPAPWSEGDNIPWNDPVFLTDIRSFPSLTGGQDYADYGLFALVGKKPI